MYQHSDPLNINYTCIYSTAPLVNLCIALWDNSVHQQEAQKSIMFNISLTCLVCIFLCKHATVLKSGSIHVIIHKTCKNLQVLCRRSDEVYLCNYKNAIKSNNIRTCEPQRRKWWRLQTSPGMPSHSHLLSCDKQFGQTVHHPKTLSMKLKVQKGQ